MRLLQLTTDNSCCCRTAAVVANNNRQLLQMLHWCSYIYMETTALETRETDVVVSVVVFVVVGCCHCC